MTAPISNLNINRNLLGPAQFFFSIERLPYTNFFGQSINLPSISLPAVHSGTPFTKIQRPGDHIDWEPLKVNFKVDEDLKNWQEIYNWIIGLGFPDNFGQYTELQNNSTASIKPRGSVFSDAIVTVLNSNNVPTLEFSFQDVFPTSLSAIKFDTTITNIEYFTAEVTFQYIQYKIRRI